MRHLKNIGLCLVAAVALGGLAATPALAHAKKCSHEYVKSNGERICESVTEHAVWQSFANCPFHEAPYSSEYEETNGCLWAESSAKEQFTSKAEKEALAGRVDLPSEFTAGKVTVKMTQPIVLKGGFEENLNTGIEKWVGARGAPTIQPVAQPGPSLTKGVDTSLLSPAELERYTYYVKDAKETKTTATVELAGPASELAVNPGNLLTEEGTAFSFPVKVKLNNPFLGESCYVGSDEHPITVEFTTGTSGELKGKAGNVTFPTQGYLIVIRNDTLVSSDFASPGVEGCGVDGGADAALNSALGLPSATGNTAVIDGTLRQTGTRAAEWALNNEI
jgi:hypothetical protein